MICKPLLGLILAITLGLGQWPASLALAQGAGAEAMALPRSVKQVSEAAIYAPVLLSVWQNTALRLIALPPLDPAGGTFLLLSVNGVDVREKGVPQIYELLRGSPGSSVEVEGVEDERTPAKRKIVFAIDRLNLNFGYNIGTLIQSLESLGNLDPFRPNVVENTATPCDLSARARCLKDLSDCETVVLSRSARGSKMLLESLLLSQSLGDIPTANEIIQRLLKEPSLLLNLENDNGRILQMVVRNLVAAGREDAAFVLCTAGARSAGAKDSVGVEEMAVLRSFAELHSPTGEIACDAFADKVAAKILNGRADYYQNLVWLSDYFRRRGKEERSLALLDAGAKLIYDRAGDDKSALSMHVGLVREQPAAALLYQRAFVLAMKGRKAQARTCLKSILQRYASTFSEAELTLLNRLPEYFPTPKQVNAAIVGLDESGKLPSPPLTEIQPEFIRFAEADDAPLAQEGQAVLATLYKDVFAGNKESAAEQADKLLSLYEAQKPLPQARYYDFTRLNMFCALLGVARTFSDRGWFDLSERVLHELQTAMESRTSLQGWKDVARVLLEAERFVNASRRMPGSEVGLEQLEHAYHSEPVSAGVELSTGKPLMQKISWRKRLRLLAMGFYESGDFLRAKIFIDKALSPELPGGTRAERAQASDDAEPTARFLLMMNAACIYTRLGEFDRARDLVRRARGEAVKPEQFSIAAVLEYAGCLERIGKLGDAIDWLKGNRTQIGALPNFPLRVILLEKLVPVEQDLGGAMLDEMLARLLLRQGNSQAAYGVICDSVVKSSGSTPYSAFFLAGQLAEKAGDFSAASLYYEGASLPTDLWTLEQESTAFLLQKAISMAEKVDGYDQKLLSKLYSSLAAQLVSESPKRTYDCASRAVALMPDSDPGKPDLINLMSTLAKQCSEERSVPRASKSGLSALAVELEDKEKACALAEISRPTDAYKFWMDLAWAEAQAGNVVRAESAARHGMNLYKADSSIFDPAHAGLLHCRLALALHETGVPEVAEALNREAVARVKVVKGIGSMAAQAQLGQFFQYYALIGDLKAALVVLDELLSTDLRQGPYQLPNHDVSHCGLPANVETSEQILDEVRSAALATAKVGNCRFALTTLGKLLAAQQSQLPGDDRRIGITLSVLGKACSKTKTFDAALEKFEKAWPILLKYEPEQIVFNRLNPEYSEALKAQGKQRWLDEFEQRQRDRMRRIREANEAAMQ